MKILRQGISILLLLFLFGAACFGLGVGLNDQEKKDEVHGVVKEKFQKRIVMNTWSHFETEKQYWLILNNGRKVQLPAYLYQTIDKGEKVSLVKIKGGNLYISERNNLEGTGKS